MIGQLLKGVPHDAYHRDDLPGSPNLSRSVAMNLLAPDGSPRRAHALHPKLGNLMGPDEEEDAARLARMENGSLLHALLLGVGQNIAIIDENDWRKGAAREARAAARARGELPVLREKYEAAEETALQIKRSLSLYGMELAGYDAEVTALWESAGVNCKARIDALRLGDGRMLDLKIKPQINLSAFDYDVRRYGLHIQHATYKEALESVFPEVAGRTSLQFLLVECQPPYDVAIQPLSPAYVDLGEQQWKRAKNRWKRCLESGLWPGLGLQRPLEPKPWQIEQEFAVALDSVEEF